MGFDLSGMSEDQRQRFHRRLRRDHKTGCLVFTGYRDRDGYGYLCFRRNGEHHTVKAHRLAFVDSGGVLTAEDPHVLHRCDNPPCCEPAHLFAGNNAKNREDMARKGRGLRSKRGNPFGAIFHQNRWVSQVRADGENHYIGRFATWQEASALAFLYKNLSLYPDMGVN